MSDVARTINEYSGSASAYKSIQFVDEWPVEQPVWRRHLWSKCLDFEGDKNGVSVTLSKTDHLGRDNYAVTEDIEMNLSREETKQLIARLQDMIGEGK